MENKLISAILVFILAVGIGFIVADQPLQASPDPNAILLTPANHISIKGEVTQDSIAEAQEQLVDRLERRGSHPYPIYIVLDTPGGDVDAGMRFFELVKAYKNIHTITINAYSMGAIFVELIAGNRLMLQSGTIMFHRMGLGLPPNGLNKHSARIRYFERFERDIYEPVAQRIGMSMEPLYKKLDEEWFLNANEALENNVIDKIVSVRCNSELLRTKRTIRVEIMPGLPALERQVSLCPLLI